MMFVSVWTGVYLCSAASVLDAVNRIELMFSQRMMSAVTHTRTVRKTTHSCGRDPEHCKITATNTHNSYYWLLTIAAVTWPFQLRKHLYIKGIIYTKMNMATPSRPFEMSLFLHQVWRNVSLHQCLSNGCSAVNGCRQNECLIKTSLQSIS